MSEVTVNKRHISLPWAVAVSAVVGIISGTGVYYSLKGDVDRNYSYSVNLEATSRERFQQVERRIERLEETSHRTVILLERIDERTAEMKRRMDSQTTK